MAGVFLCANSRNDVRKAFSKSERVDYMYRLMRIEKEKARDRQGQRTDIKENFPRSNDGQARDKTAAAFGVSGETMRKEMQIVENKRRVYKKFKIHKMCSIYSKSVHTTQKERDIHIISCAISTKCS